MGVFYCERHPDGPFVTLIAVAATYCSPDACDGDYDHLISRARAGELRERQPLNHGELRERRQQRKPEWMADRW
jgi:hypothetical protein